MRESTGLTRGQEAFLTAYIETNDRAKAEKMAGIAPRSGYAVLSNPNVQAEMQRRMRVELLDLGSLAVAKIKHHLTSDKIPAAVGQKAAEFVLNELKEANGDLAQKDLHELTPEELGKMISHLEGMASSLATPVNPPNPYD